MPRVHQLGRWTEWVVLFWILPLIVYAEWIPGPKLLLLVAVAGYCALQLKRDPTFSFAASWRFFQSRMACRALLVSTIAVAGVSLLLAWLLTPETLLALPRQRPVLWIMILILYPFFSAFPQEWIYRVFYFARYQSIFRSALARIVTSAAAFAFLHIIYDNWIAVVLSLFAGVIFSLTFYRYPSLFLVGLQHALFGQILFTVGLGRYFYEGP
ncbi:CPBP family intramembrane metalloprotease [candidate division KSB1 bacterium]|nr:CPBP family intramembrane metalloprotease [candidate division KSB1 bacterium]